MTCCSQDFKYKILAYIIDPRQPRVNNEHSYWFKLIKVVITHTLSLKSISTTASSRNALLSERAYNYFTSATYPHPRTKSEWHVGDDFVRVAKSALMLSILPSPPFSIFLLVL